MRRHCSKKMRRRAGLSMCVCYVLGTVHVKHTPSFWSYILVREAERVNKSTQKHLRANVVLKEVEECGRCEGREYWHTWTCVQGGSLEDEMSPAVWIVRGSCLSRRKTVGKGSRMMPVFEELKESLLVWAEFTQWRRARGPEAGEASCQDCTAQSDRHSGAGSPLWGGRRALQIFFYDALGAWWLMLSVRICRKELPNTGSIKVEEFFP